MADPVKDKDRANFCGYFTLGPPKAADQQREKALLAKNELAALFGEESAERSDASTASPAKATRAALDALFGLDGANPEK
ncbi:MAG: hypothetical protein H6978_11935 [Gammaproteobacteria bacterium]|nr:hypothetical protein [Gammaproteobacteria bacterium]